jgi:hypothetical protein
MARPAIAMANGLLKALVDAGIVPPETRRVVIDATVNDATIIYVEQFGTEALINLIAPNIEGAQIIMARKSSDA